MTDNNNRQEDADENSFYVGIDDDKSRLDFNGLFSYPFTNVRLLCSTPGGVAELYTATRYGRRYILKGLKSEYRNDPVYALALVKEFEIGIALEHPHIRRTLGLESVEGLGKVIVMEYIDGSTLKELIDSGKLEFLAARDLLAQIAQALDYMHDKQIFHRDLKPSNILVTRGSAAVKIIDFSLSDSDDSIVLKNPAGSMKYMAPELCGMQGAPSPATDIYSLGVIMKEIAAVTGDDDMAYIAKKFMCQNPDKRPKSLSAIKFLSSDNSFGGILSRFLSSKLLTYILVAISIGLTAYVVYLFSTNF